MGSSSRCRSSQLYQSMHLWKPTILERGKRGYDPAMEQISVETALATQTLPFQRTRGRGWGVQCKYIKKNGDRCQRYAVHGAFVCHGPHGGSLPVVRQAAETRIQLAANLALSTITYLIEHGENEAVRLRAAKYALKFAGVEPGRIRTDRHGSVRGRGAQLAIEAPKTDFDAQIEGFLAGLKELES